VRSGVVQRVPVRELPARVLRGLRGKAGAEPGAVRSGQWLLLVLVLVIGFGPTALVFGAYFDRYVLSVLPFALALLVAGSDRKLAPGANAVRLASAAVMMSAVIAVGTTHDYLAWQRARWEAVAVLEARGITRERIAGGFEVDNARTAAGLGLVTRDKAPFVLALSPVHGATELERVDVDAWLPWSVRAIHVAHREKR
jgi:hypothetical protein